MTEVVLTGTMTDIQTRDVNTKFGLKPVYTVLLDSGEKFSTNFKNPSQLGLSRGSNITVTCTQGKYGLDFKEKGGTPSASGGAATPTPRPGGGYMGASGRPFPVPKNSGEMAIIRQNALTNAVNWYTSQTGLDGSSTIGSDVDAAERIITMAYRFAEFSSGQREVSVVEAMTDAQEE